VGNRGKKKDEKAQFECENSFQRGLKSNCFDRIGSTLGGGGKKRWLQTLG